MRELVLLKSQINDIAFKTLITFRIALGLFLSFGLSALLTRFFFLISPLFLYIFSNFMYFFTENLKLFSSLAREIPNISRYRWLSLYFNLLEKAHKSRIWFFFSQIAFFSFLLFLFSLTPLFMGWLLFTRQNSIGILLIFFFEVLILDFYSLFFVRTRTSLKFFPLMVFSLIFAFLFYLNCNGYSFDYLALYTLISLLTFLMAFFIFYVEKPAFNEWNDNNIHTPNRRVPRMLFNPVFNNNWINDSAQLWTIFMPLFGRRFFERRHLAFINDEVQSLRVYNAGNANGESNLFSFEERHLVSMPAFMDDEIRFRV